MYRPNQTNSSDSLPEKSTKTISTTKPYLEMSFNFKVNMPQNKKTEQKTPTENPLQDMISNFGIEGPKENPKKRKDATEISLSFQPTLYHPSSASQRFPQSQPTKPINLEERNISTQFTIDTELLEPTRQNTPLQSEYSITSVEGLIAFLDSQSFTTPSNTPDSFNNLFRVESELKRRKLQENNTPNSKANQPWFARKDTVRIPKPLVDFPTIQKRLEESQSTRKSTLKYHHTSSEEIKRMILEKKSSTCKKNPNKKSHKLFFASQNLEEKNNQQPDPKEDTDERPIKS
ncbi:hypothetical protein [Legionella gresilensis]|uniref:hypothetical protein n=1 Tax=Legionella gresilensis TaxID=91823 RepID=UPI0010418A26|nr:hypothetical protein [Legionella gresilensis]